MEKTKIKGLYLYVTKNFFSSLFVENEFLFICARDRFKEENSLPPPPEVLDAIEPSSNEISVETQKDYEGVYVGQIMDGKRNGYGKMTYSTGETYEGNWKNNKWNGQGIIVIYMFFFWSRIKKNFFYNKACIVGKMAIFMKESFST